MVTYISTKNADKYRILFDKAATALKENTPDYLAETITDDFSISTLNEYFAYLEDLVKLSDKDDENRFYVRLPLDEDFFTIDANSRTITVPSASFGRYGVGVQGDELAEVLYFTIDRYFDSMDLANDNMNIIIQWEARDTNRQLVSGISQHFGKDIESVPGKIIFGWPISSELTQSAGSVRFAVRFYQLGDVDANNERQLVYSLSTQPAEVVINPTINYDLINKTVKEVDHGKIITSRIKNVGIYDASVPVPADPTITDSLHVIVPAGVNAAARIVDLPYDEEDGTFGTVQMAISAKPTDIGVIGYNWKKYDYDQITGDYAASGIDYTTTETTFVEVDPDDGLVEGQEYYTSSENAQGGYTYTLIDTSVHTLTVVEEENDQEETVKVIKLDGVTTTIYKKMSVATVNAVGEYGVDVQARAGANTTVLTMKKADRIKIPGPMKPVISLPEEDESITVTTEDNAVHAVTDTGAIELAVSAIAGEVGKTEAEVGENPQVTLAYNWKLDNGDNTFTAITAEAEGYTFTENGSKMAITDLPTADLDRSYYVDVVSTRNNISTTETSGEYRVTNKPKAPVVTFRGAEVTEPVVYSIPKRIRDVYSTLTFNATATGGSDNITYLWVHVNDNHEQDYEDTMLKLQVDLDGALADILGINTAHPGDADTIMSTEVATLENGVITFTGEHGSNAYQLDADSRGTYYCIVINELNNNKAASLSPFFTVAG